MKAWILVLLTAIAGCSMYQKNYNKNATGLVDFVGGAYKKEYWNDHLFMKRMSWYHGMTLYYDVIIWNADPDSNFAKWFSAAEKEYFGKCENFLVTIGYSADPTKISHVSFREQMKFNGYDDVVINNFAGYVKAHPSAIEWRLQNYKVIGFCKRSPTRMETTNLAINFPGFKQLEVDI